MNVTTVKYEGLNSEKFKVWHYYNVQDGSIRSFFCATGNDATPRWKKIHSMFNEPFEQIWIAHLSAQSRKKNLSSWEIKYFIGNQSRIRCSQEEEKNVTLLEWRGLSEELVKVVFCYFEGQYAFLCVTIVYCLLYFHLRVDASFHMRNFFGSRVERGMS